MRLDLWSDICIAIIRFFSVLKQATLITLPGRLKIVRISCCFENARHLTQTKGRSLNETSAPPLKVWMRGCIARSKHFTWKVKLLRSPYIGLFMFAFMQIKWKINKKAGHAYLRPNWHQTFHGSEKMKQREDRHYQVINCRDLLLCDLFVSFPVKVSHFTMFLSRL